MERSRGSFEDTTPQRPSTVADASVRNANVHHARRHTYTHAYVGECAFSHFSVPRYSLPGATNDIAASVALGAASSDSSFA